MTHATMAALPLAEKTNGKAVFYLRNGVKITFQFQANYFGISQLSFEANSGAI